MPWWRLRVGNSDVTTVGGVEPTAILNWSSREMSDLVAALDPTLGPLHRVRQAHQLIAVRIKPVYAVDDEQPVSVTLAKGHGSCSQRMAVLEAVARASGIATRVRGLLVDGRFWYPRFPHMRFLVPDVVVLAWPEFHLDGQWVSLTELFGSVERLNATGVGFTNTGGETLFDAVAHTAIDWDGCSSSSEACSACDLSAKVVADLGWYNSRDQLFAQHGQTMCAPAWMLAAPVLDRWSAGAGRPAA